MKRNGISKANPEFIWNQNRLALEKESIKEQMRKVLEKKKK
jgi:hypothetical protein